MSEIAINLSENELNILKKRAKNNLLNLKEQIEDIIRRSCINYKKSPGKQRIKGDDKLVEIFSREKRGKQKRKR